MKNLPLMIIKTAAVISILLIAYLIGVWALVLR